MKLRTEKWGSTLSEAYLGESDRKFKRSRACRSDKATATAEDTADDGVTTVTGGRVPKTLLDPRIRALSGSFKLHPTLTLCRSIFSFSFFSL